MLGALGAVSYTCPTDRSICYSQNSPSTHAVFQDLQAQINRFARVAGFSTISQDGLIGEGTVSACKKALAYAARSLPDGQLKAAIIALEPFAASRQILAPTAEGIGDMLRNAAVALGLAPPAPGGGGGGGGGYTPPSVPPSTSTPFPPMNIPSSGFWAARTPTQKALVGVGAAVGLGGLLLLFIKPPKKKRAG